MQFDFWNKKSNNSEIYNLREYKINIKEDKSFSIIYEYETPTIIWESWTDDYVKGFTNHIVEENYDVSGKIIESKCQLCINNSEEYTMQGKRKETYYNENDLKKQIAIDKANILTVILNDRLYSKDYIKDKKLLKLNYYNGLVLLYNDSNLLVSVHYDKKDKYLSEFTYYENNNKILIQTNNDKDSFPIRIFENDNLKSRYKKDMLEMHFEDGCIKRYPNMNTEKYNIEFLDDCYYINSKNSNKKELYSYSGMCIDKYPLIQKDMPYNSFSIKSSTPDKKFGSFSCVNILGLPIGGQLDSGITYLYLYHNDGSYIKTYSDGDNRYYNKTGDWDKTVKVKVEASGKHTLIFKDGKIETYNLGGNKI